ncbi:MAG: N-acetyltransferase [Frankia sp.]|nr:N-acetyltransferase [Frankia sp.]
MELEPIDPAAPATRAASAHVAHPNGAAPSVRAGEVRIRAADGWEDAAAIRAIYAPWVLETPISLEEEVPSVETIHERMTARPRMPWLIAEVDGEIAGYAYASKHHQRSAYRWSADVSIYLSAGHRGRGIGRTLYDHLIPEARRLGYVTLFAGVTHPNPASIGLHTSVGFRLIGIHPAAGYKLGRWWDVGWYALPPAGSPPARPSEPEEWAPGSYLP